MKFQTLSSTVFQAGCRAEEVTLSIVDEEEKDHDNGNDRQTDDRCIDR